MKTILISLAIAGITTIPECEDCKDLALMVKNAEAECENKVPDACTNAWNLRKAWQNNCKNK